MFLISIIIKSFATTFYKSKQIYLKISNRIKIMFNFLTLQMIILVCIIIYHVLKKYKNDAHIIKKFKNEFIIDEWFQSRKKVTILLIFEKWFNSQTRSDTFVKKKNCRVYKMCRKDKTRTAKVYFEIDRSKEEKVEKRRWRVYTFFYKDSLNDLNDIKNLNFKYKSKCH